jgi:hypothetical protein
MSERKFKDPFVTIGITDFELLSSGRSAPEGWTRDDTHRRWLPDVRPFSPPAPSSRSKTNE